MRYVTSRRWVRFWILGISVFAATHTSIWGQEYADENCQITELIKSGELVQASKDIDQLNQIRGTEQRVQRLRMQLLTSLRKDLPEGFDLDAEIAKHWTSVKSLVVEDSKKLGLVTPALVFVAPLLVKYKGEQAALDFYADAIGFVDAPSHRLLGSSFYSVLFYLHRSRFPLMKSNHRTEEAIEAFKSLLNQVESFADENPDDDKAKVVFASIAEYLSANLEESEGLLLKEKANENMSLWLKAGPVTVDLLESFVSTRRHVIVANMELDLPRAQSLLDDTIAKVELTARENPIAEKLTPKLQAALSQIQASINIEKVNQAMIGQPAPDLTYAEIINGEPRTITNLLGKVVLLDFWAVWCTPCTSTFPKLRSWQEKYSDRGLEIIGATRSYNYRWDPAENRPRKAREGEIVPLDEEVEMVQKFMAIHELKYPTILVSKGGTLLSEYNVSSLPHITLIDRQGRIQLIQVGTDDRIATKIENKIEQLLAE